MSVALLSAFGVGIVSHEWFRTFAQLQPFSIKELPEPSTNPRIIHLGCGDSTLTADFLKLNYVNQLSVDFSEVVIKLMQTKHPELDWRVDDVRHLQVDNSSIDIAVDEGTLDVMLHGSPWSPPDEVQENVSQYVDEVARILRSRGLTIERFQPYYYYNAKNNRDAAGKWIYITFRQPHFVKPQLTRDDSWELEVQRLEDGPGTFEYFAYIMTKH